MKSCRASRSPRAVDGDEEEVSRVGSRGSRVGSREWGVGNRKPRDSRLKTLDSRLSTLDSRLSTLDCDCVFPTTRVAWSDVPGPPKRHPTGCSAMAGGTSG